VAAAVLSMRAFRFRVAPHIPLLQQPGAVLDSLGPFALVLPLITAAWRIGWDAAGDRNAPACGWIAVGAPIVVALLAIGAALCATSQRTTLGARQVIEPFAAAIWTAAGVVLLLLAAADDLTIWSGQCAFAAGAVLLWMNTPGMTHEPHGASDREAGTGLSIVIACAIVQALAMGFVPARFLPACGGVAIAHAAMIVAIAARLASPHAAVRLGGWTAALGVMLGLGTISLRRLLPQMWLTVSKMFDSHGDPGRPPLRVAHGFGHFALEATVLLLLGIASLGLDRIPSRALRITLGFLLILGAAVLAGWRLNAA
jgi:hypothetical protein